MARSVSQSTDQWIREVLTDDTKEGKCTSIALVHIRNGQQEKEIHAIQLGNRQWDPKDLADTFRGKAESDAEQIPGMQTYCLLAFWANRKEPQARKPLLVQGWNQVDGLSTEAPTSAGLAQQAMRHLEVQTQTYTRQMQILFDASGRALETVTQSNIHLRQENHDLTTLIRDLVMGQANNRHQHRMAELEYERESNERKKMWQLAPALVNSFTGREVFPQSSEDSALIESLVTELLEAGPAAMEALGNLKISPKLMGSLASRFNKELEKRQLIQHAREANGADPEHDVNGGQLQ